MKWYLLKTKPGEEQRVETNLKASNIICYSPKIKKMVNCVSGPISVAKPLFPQFVFVRTVMDKNYQTINYTRGVAGIVNYGRGPVTVSDEVIERIRNRESDGFIKQTDNRLQYKKGRRIERLNLDGRKTLTPIFDRSTPERERVFYLLKNIL